MRIAAIDIGTNSIHMIVVQVRPDLSFEVIDREKDMVRLGAGGLDGRSLTPTAVGGEKSTRAVQASVEPPVPARPSPHTGKTTLSELTATPL